MFQRHELFGSIGRGRHLYMNQAQFYFCAQQADGPLVAATAQTERGALL